VAILAEVAIAVGFIYLGVRFGVRDGMADFEKR
jgi:hypothetical protein